MDVPTGILLVDKPLDWTSHDVCNFVKRRFLIPKVGHTGTLDPKATGVLVLLLGKFTKHAPLFVGCDKVYAGTLTLGVTTSSQDSDGDILEEKAWDHITDVQVREAVVSFKGAQKQLPPMVSAIKSKGKRLYKLARKGITVEREPRDIIVHDITCDEVALPQVRFTAHVSKGTYVRTLAHDIGHKLGTGAYLSQLSRLKVGGYGVEMCVSVDALKSLEEKESINNYIIGELPAFVDSVTQ